MSKAAERAYQFIRGEIIGGSLMPGEQLREEALAEACGVSRTPVREAMRKLEAERLIQRNDSQRSFVATLSLDEIGESFALRAMLEGHAAARATDRIKPPLIAALKAHNAAIRAAIDRDTPDVAAFLEHNRGFHAIVLEAAGSDRLSALLTSIVEQPVVLRTARHYDRDQLSRSVAEHEELVVAFRHRDPEWAKAVMVAHIRRAFHVYSEAFLAVPKGRAALDPGAPIGLTVYNRRGPFVIEIVEVGPRDGLQNEAAIVATTDKVALIGRAIDAGVRRIEVASFVNPRKVPQMADAEDVVAALPARDDVTWIGLVLNERGAERALATRIDQLGAVSVASDTFAMRNQGQSSDGSIDVAMRIAALAHIAGRSAQVTIGAAFGCPFEGEVSPDRVVAMAARLAAAGVVEIALADTIGVAVPAQVTALVPRVAAAIAPLPVRVHFHNTRNTGFANVWAAVQAGATTVDASLGGLGGCPFAPGAAGNVATEDVVYLLERSGVATGLDLRALIEASRWLQDIMGKTLPGMLGRAGAFPRAA